MLFGPVLVPLHNLMMVKSDVRTAVSRLSGSSGISMGRASQQLMMGPQHMFSLERLAEFQREIHQNLI